MTDGAGVICRRCGFENQGGDQFCGSCGAFLEWEGEVAEETLPIAEAPASGVGDEGLADLVGRSAPVDRAEVPFTPAPQPAPPVPAPPTPSAPVGSPGPDALVRCPACGIANAANRTFCQSCGTRLADASRVTEASREQIAAALASKSTPTAEPVAGVTKPRPEPPARRSGGIGSWILVMVVLGVLFGVGIVVAQVVLRSPGPSTGAEATAQGQASTGASGGAGATDAASAEPTPEPVSAPLTLTGATASSVVGDLAKFQPQKAIDGDPKTAWQEGKAKERGQWIEVTFDPSRVDAVEIANGYGASNGLHKGNHRLKAVRISIDGGEPVEVTLKDRVKAQRIELGGVAGATTLRITILSVYASRKTSVSGTPFDDAAISEITVIGVPGG